MRTLTHSCGGTVALDERGEAEVQLPDWFATVEREFRYQLTCIGGHSPVFVAEEVASGRFRIAGGAPGIKVSWNLTSVRRDASSRKRPIDEGAPDPALAPRVRDTLEGLMTGASDKEIARRLGISQHTVHQYVKTLLKAYAVDNRVQLVANLLARCSCGSNGSTSH